MRKYNLGDTVLTKGTHSKLRGDYRMTNAEEYLERKALERKTKMWLRIENAMIVTVVAHIIFVVYYLVGMS